MDWSWVYLVLPWLDEILLFMILGMQVLDYLGLTPPNWWFRWLRKKRK